MICILPEALLGFLLASLSYLSLHFAALYFLSNVGGSWARLMSVVLPYIQGPVLPCPLSGAMMEFEEGDLANSLNFFCLQSTSPT